VSHGIRPSTTQSTTALWAKSLLNAVLFFAVFMVALPLLARWLLPVSLPLPGLLGDVAGAVLCMGGLAVWAVCLDHFSRRGRGTPFPLDAPQDLVTSGPFGVIRNPIMAGELAVIWGEALLFNQLGIAVYAVLATVAGHLAVTRIEEPELGERFGTEYEVYRSRVPRWCPVLRRARS
jgi:protein-S-isoprenylcysteine O-methyltransferase Ste14